MMSHVLIPKPRKPVDLVSGAVVATEPAGLAFDAVQTHSGHVGHAGQLHAGQTTVGAEGLDAGTVVVDDIHVCYLD